MTASLDFNPELAAAVAETPRVVLDGPRLGRNIAQMRDLAASNGLALRPHIKTHKSLRIADLQMKAGAIGITASKSTEAEVFIKAGIPEVLIAYPMIDRGRLDHVLETAANSGTSLRFVVDSEAGLNTLCDAARSAGRPLSAYVELDVGLHRCGMDPEAEPTLDFIGKLEDSSHVEFAGLLSHAGQAYRAGNAEEVMQVAAHEQRLVTGLADQLQRMGIAVPTVSVGSTPTVRRHASFDGISEIRPGNYVFMDRTQVSLGVARPDEVALWVIATVVSVNSHFAIIDAGSKVLSSDAGPHGSSAVAGYGVAYLVDRPEAAPLVISGLSEEHGFLQLEGHAPEIGARVAIMPNHSCPVANLADDYLVINGSESDVWTVDARGAVR